MPRSCCSILLALLLVVGESTRVLALTADELKPLAEDDFDAKSQALDHIIAAADATALRLLEAMEQENVVATSDDRVLIQKGDVLTDPIAGAPVALQASDVQPITLNNLLRARVASGLSGLKLQAPDHSVREKAINDLFLAPDPAAKPLIEAARSRETDPALKARLDQLWALTALQDPDASNRLQAVELIGERKDPQMRSLLFPLVTKRKDGTYAETDEKVRAAATNALELMAFEQWKIEMIGTLFAGLSLGSILLLAALGLAITYGLIGVINMAHGEFLMIGAYATYVVQEFFRSHWPGTFDWYPLAAVPTSFLAAALAGFILERSVLRFLYGRPLETLLSTFGISLVLIQTVRMLFGAQNVEVSNPSWMSGGVGLMPNLILPFNRITIMVFALTVVGIAALVLNKTRLGLYIRATTQNRKMAACSGIPTWQVDSYAFAFGAGIAGLGGCALSQIGNVGPDLGQNYIIDSFMVVVLGGVGQLAGTIIGAMALGVISKVIEPFWGAVLAKIAVLVLIVLFIQKRPRGLFALKGRSVEV
ncbi:MAG: urea ABC transporter permease subunit UrtB [Verrucomicrobia bacterium]|nr:urea ABC transporter permease subunit UrtB [Verrucomicrobiota bacterium]